MKEAQKRSMRLIIGLMLATSLISLADPIEIPKSSLETVLTVTENNLENAEKAGDLLAIFKHKSEREQLKEKIKNFEKEWLVNEHARLKAKADNDPVAQKELKEIERELQKRA
jgi:hypothetical protein